MPSSGSGSISGTSDLADALTRTEAAGVVGMDQHLLAAAQVADQQVAAVLVYLPSLSRRVTAAHRQVSRARAPWPQRRLQLTASRSRFRSWT
mgnify:CR=1 FL=1